MYNLFLPSQRNNAGRVLKTDGKKTYWDTANPYYQNPVLNFADIHSAPPTNFLGDRYILNGSGSTNAGWLVGGGSVAVNDIVEWNGTMWQSYSPSNGWQIRVDFLNAIYVFDTSPTPGWYLQYSQLQNIVDVNPLAQVIIGQVYQTWADADAYVQSQTPSQTNVWIIRVSGYLPEKIYTREWVSTIGLDDSAEVDEVDSGVHFNGSPVFFGSNIKSVRIRKLKITDLTYFMTMFLQECQIADAEKVETLISGITGIEQFQDAYNLNPSVGHVVAIKITGHGLPIGSSRGIDIKNFAWGTVRMFNGTKIAVGFDANWIVLPNIQWTPRYASVITSPGNVYQVALYSYFAQDSVYRGGDYSNSFNINEYRGIFQPENSDIIFSAGSSLFNPVFALNQANIAPALPCKKFVFYNGVAITGGPTIVQGTNVNSLFDDDYAHAYYSPNFEMGSFLILGNSALAGSIRVPFGDQLLLSSMSNFFGTVHIDDYGTLATYGVSQGFGISGGSIIKLGVHSTWMNGGIIYDNTYSGMHGTDPGNTATYGLDIVNDQDALDELVFRINNVAPTTSTEEVLITGGQLAQHPEYEPGLGDGVVWDEVEANWRKCHPSQAEGILVDITAPYVGNILISGKHKCSTTFANFITTNNLNSSPLYLSESTKGLSSSSSLNMEVKAGVVSMEFANQYFYCNIVKPTKYGTPLIRSLSINNVSDSSGKILVQTTTSHLLDDGYFVNIYGVVGTGGMSVVNAQYYVKVISYNTFELYNDQALTTPQAFPSGATYTSGGNLITFNQPYTYGGMNPYNVSAVSPFLSYSDPLPTWDNQDTAGIGYIFHKGDKVVIPTGNFGKEFTCTDNTGNASVWESIDMFPIPSPAPLRMNYERLNTSSAPDSLTLPDASTMMFGYVVWPTSMQYKASVHTHGILQKFIYPEGQYLNNSTEYVFRTLGPVMFIADGSNVVVYESPISDGRIRVLDQFINTLGNSNWKPDASNAGSIGWSTGGEHSLQLIVNAGIGNKMSYDWGKLYNTQFSLNNPSFDMKFLLPSPGALYKLRFGWKNAGGEGVWFEYRSTDTYLTFYAKKGGNTETLITNEAIPAGLTTTRLGMQSIGRDAITGLFKVEIFAGGITRGELATDVPTSYVEPFFEIENDDASNPQTFYIQMTNVQQNNI